MYHMIISHSHVTPHYHMYKLLQSISVDIYLCIPIERFFFYVSHDYFTLTYAALPLNYVQINSVYICGIYLEDA